MLTKRPRDSYVVQMIQANISTAKNNLSLYLERVKNGETIIILDRHQPIATLSSYKPTNIGIKWNARMASLQKQAKISLPRQKKRKPLSPPIKLSKAIGLVDALLEERLASR